MSIVAVACSAESDAPQVAVQPTLQPCPSTIQEALESVGDICQPTNSNEVCYGNVELTAYTETDTELNDFDSPGDIADLISVERLTLGVDIASGEWGAALMRVQANLPDSLPGQNITLLLFGEAQLDPTLPDDTNDIIAFSFQSGIGDAPCREAPESGLLIQTPEGIGKLTLNINQVDIALGSTAYLQAQPNDEMRVSVIAGEAEVTAQGVTQVVKSGNVTRIELDDDGNANSEPSEPEALDVQALAELPTDNLDLAIPLTTPELTSTFAETDEGWRLEGDGDEITLFTSEDDPTTDGYICATDRSTGVYWYFKSPEAWAGDRSDLLGGSLTFSLRTEPGDGRDVRDDVILVSNDVTLAYRTPDVPNEEWSAYTVPLSDDVVWLSSATGSPATNDEIEAVLADLIEIQIRGEYISGSDTGCMDEASLNRPLE